MFNSKNKEDENIINVEIKENNKWYKKVFNIINKYKILNIILFIISFILIFLIYKLGIVPNNILIIGSIIIVFLDCIPLLNIFFKGKRVLIFSYVMTLILVIVNLFLIYYVNVTDNFFDKHFGNNKITYSVKFDIITSSNSSLDISNLDNKKLGYYKDSVNIDKALKKLNKKTDNILYEDLIDMFNRIDVDINCILIEDSLYSLLFTSQTSLVKENYKIIHSFEIEVLEDTGIKKINIVDEGKDSVDNIDNKDNNSSNYITKTNYKSNNINIYIGGTDFTGQYYDFNMIVTINPDSKKVLLTSIPRDYHISVASKNGRKDNLNYIGVWGLNTTMESLQNLLNINIDYYVKVNTNSLVGIVDKLGGITYCSDYQYYTTHDLVLDTYNDTGKNKLYVEKGCKRYNGIEILTIARERLAFKDGDRQRQKNCQDIIVSIFKEMLHTNNIVNYESILNALGNLYTTSVPRNIITSYLKDMLSNNWKIEKQSLDGYDSIGYVHLTSIRDYVMEPYSSSVTNAGRKIRNY